MLDHAQRIESARTSIAYITGQTAIWGRPHGDVTVVDGDPAVWERWRALPSEAFQFGAWD